jgi:hypothetical protein
MPHRSDSKVFVCAVLAALFHFGCASTEGEGSETHLFRCSSDAQCGDAGPNARCVNGECVANATGAEPTPAEPGVCFGENTVCDPPTILPPEPGPEVLCEPVQGAEISVVWQGELGTLECPVPGCPASNPQIALGSDGELWAVAELREPDPASPSTSPGAEQAGYAVMRFDATGNRVFATAVDTQSRLSTAFPNLTGLSVNENGDLERAAPTASLGGIELRRYDRQGITQLTRSLVGSAILGSAGWSADGSLTLLYRYVAPEPVSTEDAGSALPNNNPLGMARTNVARFAADGRLLWNQTALSSLGPEDDPLVSEMRASLAGVDDGGETTIRASLSQIDGERTMLLKLDANGNVAWARELANAWRASATSLADGGALVLHSDAMSNSFVERLSDAGESLWRAGLGPLQWSVPLTADEQGRALVLESTGDPLLGSLLSISADGTACTRHAHALPGCMQFPDGSSGCGTFRFLPVGPNDLYFGVSGLVGLARMP